MEREMDMNRNQAIPYIGYAVDSALCVRAIKDMPKETRLIGWQCGFEPMFVAVWSAYDGVTLDDDESTEIAIDLLQECNWFSGEPTDPDYVL